MGKKIRFLFIIASFGLFVFIASKSIWIQIKKVAAIPGTLQLGSQTTSTTYINNDAIYNSNLFFGGGTGGRGGKLDTTGAVYIVPTGTPDNSTVLIVNDRTKTNTLSVGTSNNTNNVEVGGSSNFNGNVGIGVNNNTTGAYTTPLTVYGGSAAPSLLRFIGTDGTAILGESGADLTVNNDIRVAGSGTSYFSAGKVGIGTTSPVARLDVVQNDIEAARFYGTGTNSGYVGMGYHPTGDYGLMGSYSTGGAAKNMAINVNGGNIAIGVIPSTYKLDVNGTFQARGSSANVNTDATGNLYAQGALTVGSASLDGNFRVYKNSGAGGRNTAVLTNGTPVAAGVTKSSVIQFKDNNNATQIEMGNDRSVNGDHNFYIYDGVSAADRLFIGSNGNVGVGTTAPSAKLEVAAGSGATLEVNTPAAGNPAINVGRVGSQPSIKSISDWLIMDSNTAGAALNYFVNQPVVLAQGGGNVGVGTTTPAFRLQVMGDIQANGGWLRNTGATGLYNDSYGMYFYPGDSNANYWTSRSGYGIKIANTAGALQGYVYHDGGSNFGLLGSAGAWAVQIPAGQSYVNIPTSLRTPIMYDLNDTGYYVDPNGNSRMANAYFNSALINWPGYNGITQAYGNYFWPGRNDGSGANWQQSWYLASNSSYGLYTNTGMYFAGNTYMPRIYDSENTGYYLDPSTGSNIYGVTAVYGFIGGTSIQNHVFDFNSGYQGISYISMSGGINLVTESGMYCGDCYYSFGSSGTHYSGVGFGTSTPNAALHVMNDNALIELGNYHYRYSASIINSCTGAAWAGGINGGIYGRDYSTGCGDEWFVAWQSEDGAENSRLLIMAKNDANDDVYIRGTGGTTTGTGDLAELYKSSDDLKLGEVVVNDPVSPAGVKRATQAYENKIVGVTSARPFAIVMSQNENVSQDPAYKPISLAGKIIVRISLENGPVKTGDPLTTSSTPGYAMKATKAGMIIGRAFEDYDGSVQSSDGSEKMYTDTSVGCSDCEKVLRVFPRTYKTLPGTYQKGTMVVSMGVMWWDPDMTLTASGDLKLAETVHGQEVRNANNDLITKVAGFAEVVVAKVRAGLIETKKLIVDGVDILQKLNDTQAQLNNTKAVVEKQQQQIEELQKAIKALQAK